jgi:lipoprotein-anchoring transpeptidase ErfK/SrfK
VLQDKTDLIIVSVFLIMIIFCVISSAVFQRDDQEAPQDRSEVAGIYESSLTAVSEGSAEGDISEPASSDLPGASADEEIQKENSGMDDLVLEPEREQIIDFSNSDDFKIEVDIKKQRVFVYYKGEIIREMICSTGVNSSPTPSGEFTTTEKIEYDWVDRFNMGAFYWVRFYKSYLFHSIPFDKNGNMKVEELKKLGCPASHGCVRLELEEAKWLYDKLPLGVKVWIY